MSLNVVKYIIDGNKKVLSPHEKWFCVTIN